MSLYVCYQKNQPCHAMSKRSNAVKKMATSMLSPFNERAVDVKAKLTTEEKEMYQWLESYSNGSE